MNLGLLGAIGGLGQGLQTVGANMQKQQDEQDREERSLIMNQKLMAQKADFEDARRARILNNINTGASAKAAKRVGLLGASATDSERKTAAEVTAEDRYLSANEQGYVPDSDVVNRNDKNVDRAEAREDRRLQQDRLDEDRRFGREIQLDNQKETKRYHDILDTNSQASIAARASGGAGKDPTLNRDKFDSKTWHEASKDLEKYTSTIDMDGKAKTNTTALNFAQTQMNKYRNAGADPYDAVSTVGTQLSNLRDRADARLKTDSNLTPETALAAEIRDYQAAKAKAASDNQSVKGKASSDDQPEKPEVKSSSAPPAKAQAPSQETETKQVKATIIDEQNNAARRLAKRRAIEEAKAKEEEAAAEKRRKNVSDLAEQQAAYSKVTRIR